MKETELIQGKQCWFKIQIKEKLFLIHVILLCLHSFPIPNRVQELAPSLTQ